MSNATQKKPFPLVALSTGVVVFWLVVAAFPFLWTMWGSFKVEGDFFSRADWMNAISGPVTERQHGSSFTTAGYEGAWVQQEFWRAVLNTAIVTVSVVVISLTLGTLGGYALARSGFKYTFWLLTLALVFRAMPHITLVSGYLLPFFQLNIWGYLPTTIVVLVAINQPFTLWMLHSFFLSTSRRTSTRRPWSTAAHGSRRSGTSIIPVMWPGVVTTGLFSFLLAYNDFAVTVDAADAGERRPWFRGSTRFLGSTQEEGNVMFAVAAVVSAIVPLFVLILFFQRQIVSGLTAGAVKG